MKWGVRKSRSTSNVTVSKTVDKRGNLKKKLDSLSRERSWNKVVRNIDKLNTKDINVATRRINLENDLKILSKSKVGSSKDKADYIRRANMSDSELSRKVVRLRAKDNLSKAVKSASKEQREFGEKVVRIGGSLGVKYAVNKSIKPKDVFDAVKNPKGASASAKDTVLGKMTNSNQRDILKTILDKIDNPENKK